MKNRELKFRAWDGGGWRYLDDNFYLNEYGNFAHISGPTFDECVYAEWNVYQYTGRKDNIDKGNELYEADIVEGTFSEANNLEEHPFGFERLVGKIVFKNGGFSIDFGTITVHLVEMRNDGSFMWRDGKMLYKIEDVKKIGNIYENPELLND